MGYRFTHKAYDKTNHHLSDIRGINGKIVLSFLFLLVVVKTGFAQIAVTQNANTQSLAQLLAGTGVTISNYTKTCDNNGTGTFTANNTNLGITQGVVLASGRVQSIPQTANNFASTQFANSADPQLSNLTVGAIYDKCILEFDIVPQGTDLRFEYVFASEEYPEFVCSPYNDVFGFFISGPDPAGGNYTNKNIATLPGSTTPVFINSVNTGMSGTYSGTTWNSANCISLSNTNYYINNLNPVNQTIVYDGMTVVLPATAKVVPCQTYHLKLAIADVGDRIYDSGVFLKAYSFTSAAVTVAASAQLDYAGFTSAYEGCVGGTFTVNTSTAQSIADTIDIAVTGTATNGTDYITIPQQVIIPAGQTSVTIPLTPLTDGIAEPGETVTVTVLNPCTGLPVSSATLTIEDNIPISLTISDSLLCLGESATLTATGGLAYSWAPTATLSGTNTNVTTATPLANTNYMVTVSFGGCTQTLSQMLYISNPLVNVTAPATSCSGNPATITSVVSGAALPVSYIWSNGTNGASTTVTTSGTYVLTVTDAHGCSVSASASVSASNLSIASAVTPVSCFGGSNGSATVSVTGGSSPYIYNWSNGANTAAISNRPAGTYNVTVTDAGGCSATALVNISQPTAPLTSVATSNQVNCFGGNNGSVTISTSGGTTPYSYQWNNNSTAQNLQNIAAGNYIVTITDAKNCSATAQAFVIQPAAAVSIAATPVNIACFGNSSGSVTTQVTGGTTPYAYLWNTGSSAQNLSGMNAGNYTLTVTDANGCSAVKNVSISQPSAALSVSLAANAVACYGNATGSAAANVSGGVSPYSLVWNNNATGSTITNLTAGNYAVTVTDANLCTVSANTIVAQPTASLLATTSANPVNCFGGSNGSVTINTTGGTTPYSYQWNNNSTAQNLQNIAAGNYIVTITDAKNCSATAQAFVTQPAAAVSIAATPVNIACFGNSSGSVTIQVTGGTTPYAYLWNTGGNAQNLSGISAGNYTLTVTDSKGCSAVKNVIISQPSAALSVSLAANAVACYGTATGSAAANVSGGVSPYSLVWNNNATGSTITNLTAGNYAVTVTDANLCTVSANTIVAQPTASLLATTSANPVNCFGGSNGSVTINTTGGTTPYSYQWNNNSTAQSLQNLSAGNYTVTVTDAKNCSATAQAVVTQPAAPVYVAVSSDSVSCYGGSNGGATASVIGGTMPYSFVWSNNQTSQNLTAVVSGTYNVTVADSKNCQATATVYVAQPPAPLQVTAAKTDAGCYGSHDGEATLAASGGTPPYFFEWSNNSAQQNQTGLAAGNYTVTTTDVNGCSAVNSLAISQPTPLLVNATAANVLCYNSATGSAQVAVSGGTPGYVFNWSNGKTTQSIGSITAGIYSVTVSDNQQCSALAMVSVSQPSAAVSASALVLNTSCNSVADGSLLLTVSGGTSPYAYQWSNGAVTQHVQNLSAGNYTVTITDANACSFVLTSPVAEPAALTLTEGHTAVKCYGQNNGTVQLNAGGGTAPYSYQWNNGSALAASQNLAAGSYSVTVYDARQCTATGSFTITQPQPLSSVLTVNHALCYGAASGSIQSTVSGGTAPYSYAWSNNTAMQHLQNAAAGNYTLTVTDANGCPAVSNTTIQQPAAISITENSISPLCFGSANGSIDLTVAGGTPAYVYAWSNGATTPHAANIPAGVYTVTVTDANNCTVSKSVNVSQPAAVVVHEWHSNVSCNNSANGSIQVSATGGTPAYQYFWSNGGSNNQLNNLTAGGYGVTVVDAHGCGAAVSSIVITEPDSLNIALTATDVKCSETATGTIVSAVTGGTLPYNYHWSNNAATAGIQNIEAGVYSLTVTDANGCRQVNSAMVNDVPPLVVKAIADSVPCAAAKGDITLWVDGGVAPYSFLWSNGAVTSALQQATSDVYYVTVSDANGCEVDTAFEIENTHQFSVDATGGGTVTLGQTVQLQAVSTGSLQVSYQWTPATGVVCAGCANTVALPVTYTVYTVLATDTNGCTAQDTVSADVIEDYTVFTPNAFTPNGDGNNDYFQFYGNAAGLKFFNIMIFDRWGEKLYEADQPDFKWDGMYKGELVPPGVYVYVMKLVFINGHTDEIHKGSLTVIR